MLHHGFLRSSAWMLMIPVLMGSGGCWGRDGGSPDEEVCGFLGTAVGIEGAYVHVYPLDEVTGRLLKAYPIASTSEPTDANGEFCLTGKDSDITGMLLFVARGGEVREYWSDTPAELGVEHLSAVVEHWTKGRPLSITPWTTLAYKLANGRYRNGEEDSFYAAVLTAEQVLYEHFIGSQLGPPTRNHCDSRLNCLRPEQNILGSESINIPPEKEQYQLTLISLSSLAADWSQATRTEKYLNSVKLITDFLALDASDGRLDGFQGSRTAYTTVNTLRSELVHAFIINTPLGSANMHADYSAVFARIASNIDPRLFGDGAPEPFDLEPPSVHVMNSQVFDERDDRIIFDENRVPQHIHDVSSVIPLAAVFEPGCPEIHKHVNLLSDNHSQANPLQWRFAVHDDYTGVFSVRAEVTFGPSYHPVRYVDGIITSTPPFEDGSHEVIVTVTASDVPELLELESEFKISVIATDGVGNESVPLEGCWQHVPRAAPLWLGPVIYNDGKGSISSYSLADDNLSHILNGPLSSKDAPILASFEVLNPNSQMVYLSLSSQDVTGQFAWTWKYDYIPIRSELRDDSCIHQGTCQIAEPVSRHIRTPQPPPSIPAGGISLTADDDFCHGNCSDFPIPIGPSMSIFIQVRWSDFEIMLPEGVLPGQLDEFEHLGDGQGLATGVNRDYIQCLEYREDGTCTNRQIYEELITMRDARLQVQGAIIEQTSPNPGITPRRPAGQRYTSGTVQEFERDWITFED